MSTESDKEEFWLPLIVGLVVGLAVSGIVAGCVDNSHKQRAVDAGVGKYIIDPKTGRTDFVYGKRLRQEGSSRVHY